MTDKKVALVTGASRGIGKACAIELAKAYAKREKAEQRSETVKSCKKRKFCNGRTGEAE